MITLEKAVSAAKAFLAEIDTTEKYLDLRVEEVEMTQSGDWEITLGFHRKLDLSVYGNLPLGFGSPILRENRVYKTILVDKETGQAKRLKIREIAAKLS